MKPITRRHLLGQSVQLAGPLLRRAQERVVSVPNEFGPVPLGHFVGVPLDGNPQLAVLGNRPAPSSRALHL